MINLLITIHAILLEDHYTKKLLCTDQEEISVLNLKPTSYSSCLKEKKNLMPLLLKTIFNQISYATGRRNSLQMLLLLLITRGNTISGKNLPKNARKKPNTPKRLVNLLCRLTGSKKSEEVVGPDYESKFIYN